MFRAVLLVLLLSIAIGWGGDLWGAAPYFLNPPITDEDPVSGGQLIEKDPRPKAPRTEDPRAKMLRKLLEEERLRRIETLKEEIETINLRLRAYKRARIVPRSLGERGEFPFAFPSKEEKQKAISRWTEELELSKKALQEFRNKTVHVLPWFDENYAFSLGAIGKLYDPRAFQVLSEDSLLARTENGVVRIEGLSTEGVVDGALLKANPAYEVTGTKTYETVNGGTNTVYVLRPIDIEAIVGPPPGKSTDSAAKARAKAKVKASATSSR